MAPDLSVADLVDMGDLDELLRRVDGFCDTRDWEGLADLRRRCRAAFERGRQLWPAASHAEYRLALEAPGRWAGPVVEPGAGRFALGPLSEVAASTHTWDELAPHLPLSPEAALVAHERVVRGEDLRSDGRVDPHVVDLPLVLQPWEPAYPLAHYRAYEATFDDAAPAPTSIEGEGEVEGEGEGEGEVGTGAGGPAPAAEAMAVEALVELVSAWTTQSGGTARAVAVQGHAADAVAAVAGDGNGGLVLVPVDAAPALATMAWAGASGGARGRRRGMAQGRFAAWWAAAALAGDAALDAWPDLGPHLGQVHFYRWHRTGPATGWSLRLAAERPAGGVSFAIEATDRPPA
ncbi:MAG: hypothetical protein AB1673_04025 [Actinomycetota bacterium]